MNNFHGITYLGLSYNGSTPVKKTENFWFQPARKSIQLNKSALIGKCNITRSTKNLSPFASKWRWRPKKSPSKLFLRYKFSQITGFDSNESSFSSIFDHKRSKNGEDNNKNISFSKKLSISPKICFGLTKMKKLSNSSLSLGQRREDNKDLNLTKTLFSPSALKRSLSMKNAISNSSDTIKTLETTSSESYVPWFIKYPHISPVHKR